MAAVVARETIPEHLPERLTIAFWFGYWATDTQPGEGFADLEGAVRDLVARGFNTIRIDGLWSWCFTPDGSRRPPVEIGHVADPGYCDYGAGTVTRGGGPRRYPRPPPATAAALPALRRLRRPH